MPITWSVRGPSPHVLYCQTCPFWSIELVMQKRQQCCYTSRSSQRLISSAIYLAPVTPLLVALPQPSGQCERRLPVTCPRFSWASMMMTANAVLNRRKQEHMSKTFSGVKWSNLASPSMNAEHVFRPGFLPAPRPQPRSLQSQSLSILIEPLPSRYCPL